MNEKAATSNEIHFGALDRQFILSVVRRYVRDDNDAADVAQDAMLLAYRYRDSFRGDSHYRTWLYRIAATSSLSFLRSAKRRANRVGNTNEQDILEIAFAQPPRAPHSQLESQQEVTRLMQEVAKLEPSYRQVVQLRCADKSDAEVARELGVTVSTVKIRAHRARKMLRYQLAA